MKGEKILIKIEDNRKVIFFVAITLLALVARLGGINFESLDFKDFLDPWYKEIAAGGGLRALGKPVGNYGVPYQLLILLFTYLPFKPLYAYKGLSIIFDYVLAFALGKFVCTLKEEKIFSKTFVIVYAVILLLPTVIMDSSTWAQCDSIYVSFMVFGLDALYEKKYMKAYILFGLSFAFKLQAIFILPFLLIHYLREKKYSILHFFLIIVVDYILYIPSFLVGRSLLAPITVYFGQVDNNRAMYFGFPSFWTFLGNDYQAYMMMGFGLCLTIFALGLYYAMEKKIDFSDKESFVNMLVWSLWTVMLFMPGLHERYGYALDVICVAMVIYKFSWQRLMAAVIPVMTSCITYSTWLAGETTNYRLLACFYLGAYIIYTANCIKDKKERLD